MMTSTAAKARADRLEKMARAAIDQYNKDMAAGGEPLYPDWALELLGLIADYDMMVFTLAKQCMEVVSVVDFQNGRRGLSVVQRAAS